MCNNKVRARNEREVTAEILDAAALFGLKLERRNVGMATGASGRPVRFGEPGEPDYCATAVVAPGNPGRPNNGRRLCVEIKHEGFNPGKLRGAKAEHFARQRAAMERVNADGGLAAWFDSAAAFINFYQRVLDWPVMKIEFDDQGFPFMTDEPEA